MSYVTSILFNTEGDELVNQVIYPYFSPRAGSTPSDPPVIRARKLESNEVAIQLQYATGTVSSGAPKSLELMGGTTDYTVTASKTAKLILVIKATSASVQFKVWQSDSADTASGTAKYTYTTTSMSTNDIVTVCPEWDTTEATFAAAKYITIEITAGSNLEVLHAAVIETPV